VAGVYTGNPLAQKSTNAGRIAKLSFRFLDVRAELAHFPGVAGVQEFVQVARAALGDDVLYLLVHDVLVAGQVVPCAKDADGRGETGAMLHVGEQEGVRRAGMMRVVNDEIGFGDAVAERHDFDVAIGFAANALVVVFAEYQRLAVFEL